MFEITFRKAESKRGFTGTHQAKTFTEAAQFAEKYAEGKGYEIISIARARELEL